MRNIPIWIKEPIYLFCTEVGKIPVKAAYYHAICNYADNRGIDLEKTQNIYRKRQRYIYEYLYNQYGNILHDLKYTDGEKQFNAPIWVFWWQGEDVAPELVKLCIKSIRLNAGNHPVHIITKDNYKEFTSIPEKNKQKLEDGRITLTHFSDILRMNLIAYNGGFWVDSTIFCSKKIEERIFDQPIYTGRNPNKDFKNISNWEWTGFAISGWKGNGLFVAAVGIHESAWGTSKIALQKHNLFGYGAYDSNPYNGAYQFTDYSECIDLIARVFVKYYLNPKGTSIYGGEQALGTYYNGPTLEGINKKYATDKN